MAWIELHQSLWTHRKTLALADSLDIDETYAAAHLARLWTWALDNVDDGALPSSARVIASAAGWRGDRDLFLAALLDCGWVEACGDGLTIHNYDEYFGRLATLRAANRDRKRRSRAANRDSHTDVTVWSRDVTGHLTRPNQTRPDQTEPLPSEDAAQAPAKKTRGRVAVISLTPEERASLDAEFSHLPDVSGEIDLALSHEAHKKYPTNQYGYVRNWLRRANAPPGNVRSIRNQRQEVPLGSDAKPLNPALAQLRALGIGPD